jgi:hypothetical protein
VWRAGQTVVDKNNRVKPDHAHVSINWSYRVVHLLATLGNIHYMCIY